MTIPRENALAFFPAPVTVGNVTLRPLTLAGAVRLAGIGVDLGRSVPRERLLEAAWVLSEGVKEGGESRWRWTKEFRDSNNHCPPPPTFSTSTSFDRFCRRAKVGLRALSNAVETVLNDAFETYVRPAATAGAPSPRTLNPKGLGWPLEYAEFLCAEYGWSWETAIETPVATVFALYAASRHRNGGKSGMDYLERAYAKTLSAKEVEKVGGGGQRNL